MNESMTRIYRQYVHSFSQLRGLKEPQTMEEQHHFNGMLTTLFAQHSDVLQILAKGVREGSEHADTPLSDFVDDFLCQRMSVRLLASHYLIMCLRL